MKVIVTTDTTGLEPEADTFINNVDSGKVYIGDGSGGQREVKTNRSPLYYFIAGAGNYTMSIDDEFILVNGVIDIIIDGSTGYEDGRKFIIKNAAGSNIDVKVKVGDASRFNGVYTSKTLADQDSLTFIKIGTTYHII